MSVQLVTYLQRYTVDSNTKTISMSVYVGNHEKVLLQIGNGPNTDIKEGYLHFHYKLIEMGKLYSFILLP